MALMLVAIYYSFIVLGKLWIPARSLRHTSLSGSPISFSRRSAWCCCGGQTEGYETDCFAIDVSTAVGLATGHDF